MVCLCNILANWAESLDIKNLESFLKHMMQCLNDVKVS